MDLKDVGSAIAILVGVVGPAIGYGKMSQMVKSNQETNNDRFREHRKLIDETSGNIRDHFRDSQAHWTINERALFFKQIEALEKRFDKQDRMIEELLRRTVPPQ